MYDEGIIGDLSEHCGRTRIQIEEARANHSLKLDTHCSVQELLFQ